MTMHYKIHYGKGTLGLDVDGTHLTKVDRMKAPGPAKDPAALVRKAVDSPLKARSLREFVTDPGHRRLLFIVNDTDRPTPTPVMLGAILDLIKEAMAMNGKEVKVLVGSGSHKPPGEAELKQIFGDTLPVLRPLIVLHAAKDDKRLVTFGTTKRGTICSLDSWVDWADSLIILGSIEPHYFAGFTGGRKWIIGCGAYTTLEANHRFAISNECRPMKLKDNPVHLDLVEMQDLVKKDKFGIMAVQDADSRVLSVLAGDMTAAFEAGVDISRKANCVVIEGPVDIVVAVAREPLSRTLYQAQKAMEHGGIAVKDGGHLILVAACEEGCGPPNFVEYISSGTPEEILANVDKQYKLGYHKSARILLMVKRMEVHVVTELNEEVVRAVHMKKAKGLQEAVDETIGKVGKAAKLLVLENGGVTVPQMVCELRPER